MNSADTQDLAAGYDAVRRGAGVVDRPDRAPLVVGGADRVGWLQGLLSNDVAALREGQGCYAAYLTPQGRMLADLHVVNLGAAVLLDIPAIVRPEVVARLERFVIMEDVQLADVSDRVSLVAVHGPRAAEVLGGVLAARAAADAPALEAALAALGENDAVTVGALEHARGPDAFSLDDGDAIVVANRDCGTPGFSAAIAASGAERLRATLQERGARPVSAVAWNALRIEAGRPLFGIDMDEETIPLEAGIEDRAISFTKGCYVGQEVIVRVRDRGHGRVARKLVGLVSAADAVATQGFVAAGDDVLANGRTVGRVTSSTVSPSLRRAIALAYVHRDFVEEGTLVSIGHQGHERPMIVARLPFLGAPARELPA